MVTSTLEPCSPRDANRRERAFPGRLQPQIHFDRRTAGGIVAWTLTGSGLNWPTALTTIRHAPVVLYYVNGSASADGNVDSVSDRL